jgi:hypothetical protein
LFIFLGGNLNYWQPNQCPNINRVSPNIGDISGGDLITIIGDLFIDGLQVFFGDKEAVNVSVHNSTHVNK